MTALFNEHLLIFSVAKLLTTVCATGGGAFKFEEEFKRVSCDSCVWGNENRF